MKHVHAGIALLLILGLLGALLTLFMDSTQERLSGAMTQAAEAALAENWAAVDSHTAQALSLWEQRHRITAAVVDHELLEQADSMLAELSVYRSRRESTEFAVVCMCLVRQFEAIGESQSLRWWHLL